MTHDMSGKTVVITGAGGGVGSAAARRFAAAGATLVLGDLDGVRLEELAGELAAVTTVHAVVCDVSSVADVENLMAEAVETGGGIDVLVNTAGLWVEGPSESMTEADWDRVVDVNLKGTFFCCSRALPELKKTAGLHRQPELRLRARGDAGDGDLHGVEGWREPAHQGARPRGRRRPRARQRGLPRRHHDADARSTRRTPSAAATPRATSAASSAATRRATRRASSRPRRWPSSSSIWPRRRRRRSPAPTSRSTSAPRPATATTDDARRPSPATARTPRVGAA